MAEPKPFQDLQHLLFEAPLYAAFKLPPGKFGKGDNLKGYCPNCKGDSIFKVIHGAHRAVQTVIPVANELLGEIVCRCVQQETHILRFQLRINVDFVEKWGQYPSAATLAQGDTKRLRKGLDEEDAAELVRAVGLAGHGIGIGSFVYFRSVFERVINRKLEELKAQEGWSDDALEGKRMVERIELMADHLPDFVVKNKRLYGILSLAIHELEEKDCLDFFDIAYASIRFILDDDLRKREEASERRQAERAIANYNPRGESPA
jgi:hypothetical protein